MKGVNLSTVQLLDVYAKEVGSILEMAFPVWLGGLTQKKSKDIESTFAKSLPQNTSKVSFFSF